VSTAWSELAAIFFFIAVGWVALWPARRCLGAWGYHTAALPMGLLSAALAGTFSTLANRPLDAVSAIAGALLLIAGVQVCSWLAGGSQDCEVGVGWRSFAIAAGAMGGLALVVGVVRLTVSNNDSVMSYWPLGVQLARTGQFTTALTAARSALIPGMNAIHVVFGSDWAYVIYPMLAATMVVWLAVTLLTGPLGASDRSAARWIVGSAVVALVIEPSFIFNALFVHSHMISGLYLFMSLTCLWLAGRQDTAEQPRGAVVAFLVLAGAFAAGFALGRPDGLAYQFVPVAAAISLLTRAKVDRREVLAFFGPLLFVELSVYAATYAELGLWDSGKLDGKTTLVVLGVLVLSAAGPWIVQALDRVSPVRLAGERFFSLLVSVAAVLTVAALALKWDMAGGALDNARANLFGGAGGYHYLWYGVVILLVLSVFTGDALRPASWTRSPFLSILLFFIVAALVHGLSHEGRVGPGDSLNRVAFHALPVVIWYVAAVVARIVGQATPMEVEL